MIENGQVEGGLSRAGWDDPQKSWNDRCLSLSNGVFTKTSENVEWNDKKASEHCLKSGTVTTSDAAELEKQEIGVSNLKTWPIEESRITYGRCR